MVIDIVIVISFLIINLIIGIISGSKIKNIKDYAIGNRNISNTVLAITVVATLIGGGSSLGTSTEVYKYGIIVCLAKYGVSLGMLLIAFFIAPKMEKFFGLISVGEIMGKLYGNNARIITGISGSLLCMGRMAAQVLAFGYITSYFFHIDEKVAIMGASLIMVIYSAYGGIRAIIYTDVLQFIVIIVTIPIVLKVGLDKIGGLENLISAIPIEKKTINPNPDQFRKYLFVFLYMSLPLLTPPFVQRMLMASDVKQIRKSFISTAIIDFTFTSVATCIGLLALILFPTVNPNHAFLELVHTLTPIGIKGLVIIGLLSILISTADAYLNMLSVSVINDIVRPLNVTVTKDKEIFYLRMLTFVTGIISVSMALYFKNIFDLAVYATNFWGPIVVAPLLGGIFGMKGNSKSFMFGSLSGFTVFIIWEALGLKEITYIYSTIPSVFVNFAVFILHVKFVSEKKLTKIHTLSIKSRLTGYFKRLLNSISSTSKINILKICDQTIEKDSMPYEVFSLFMLINQISQFFLIRNKLDYVNIILIFLSGILCVLLLVWNKIGNHFKKYHSLFWYVTITFTLLLAPYYNLFKSNFQLEFLITSILSTIVLSVIVNWKMYLILSYLALSITTIIFNTNWYNLNLSYFHNDGFIWFLYTIAFTSFLSMFFKKRNEENEHQRIEIARSLGGIITHELKSPLMKLDLFSNRLSRTFIHDKSNIITSLREHIKILETSIEVISFKLRGTEVITDFQNVAVDSLLLEAINNYPFLTDKEKNKVRVINLDLFDIFTDKQLFFHTIFNLISNSLYYIKNKPDGFVKISTYIKDEYNIVSLEDNGPGIPPDFEDKIFRSYYTTKRNGTGLGLYFCNEAMKKHNGFITCESKYGIYTKFILYFPKVIREEVKNVTI